MAERSAVVARVAHVLGKPWRHGSWGGVRAGVLVSLGPPWLGDLQVTGIHCSQSQWPGSPGSRDWRICSPMRVAFLARDSFLLCPHLAVLWGRLPKSADCSLKAVPL